MTTNKIFKFLVYVYPADGGTPAGAECGLFTSSGSQEDRARRRLLGHLHSKGLMAARVVCQGWAWADGRPAQ
jgi:hypothetical protein